jgi:dynein heavy chain
MEAENHEQTLIHIDDIPIFTAPNVFGLHSNAEIQYYNNAAKSLWTWTLEMQTSDGGDGGGSNREDYIMKI